MQDRYVGDIGDFGKYGLLSFISKETMLKLGVNWYLTETSVKEIKKDDGKFINYLLYDTKYRSNTSKYYVDQLKNCDKDIYEKLQRIIIKWLDEGKDPNFRHVQLIQGHNILPSDTLFYSKILKNADREQWHQNGIECLSQSNLVFLDPDNGIIAYKKTNSSKHVCYEEIEEYFKKGFSLAIYQHADRTKIFEDSIKEKTKKITELLKICSNQIISLRYKRGTARAYFLVMQKEHSSSIRKAVNSFVKIWQTHFRTY
jgi:hypothetical protein